MCKLGILQENPNIANLAISAWCEPASPWGWQACRAPFRHSCEEPAPYSIRGGNLARHRQSKHASVHSECPLRHSERSEESKGSKHRLSAVVNRKPDHSHKPPSAPAPPGSRSPQLEASGVYSTMSRRATAGRLAEFVPLAVVVLRRQPGAVRE